MAGKNTTDHRVELPTRPSQDLLDILLTATGEIAITRIQHLLQAMTNLGESTMHIFDGHGLWRDLAKPQSLNQRIW